MLLVWILLLSFYAFTTSSKSEPEQESLDASLNPDGAYYQRFKNEMELELGMFSSFKRFVSNTIDTITGSKTKQIIDGPALADEMFSSRMAALASCWRYEDEQEENRDKATKWLEELEAAGCKIDRTQKILARDDSLTSDEMGVKFIWFQTIPDCGGKKTFVIGHVGTDPTKAYDIMSDALSISDTEVQLGGEKYMAGTGFVIRWKAIMGMTVIEPATFQIPAESSDATSVPTSVRDRIKYEISMGKPDVIRVIGHSLGGAMASLHAVDLAEDASITQPVILSTYGAPRVFVKEMNSAKRAQNLFPVDGNGENVCFRYVNYGDSVPSVPPSTKKFQHFGRPLYVNLENWDTWNLKPEHVDFTPWNNLDPVEAVKNHLLKSYIERISKIRAVYKKGGGQNGKVISGEEHVSVEDSVATSEIQSRYPFELLAAVFFFGTACIFSIQRKYPSASAIKVHLLDEEEH